MSKPQPGTYYIVNNVATSDGTELAIKYEGAGTTLKVIEKGTDSSQKWRISNYKGDTQTVSPVDATPDEVAFKGDTNLTVVPPNGNVWNIRGDNGIYTIQTGDFKLFWGLQEAAVGQAVYVSGGQADAKQEWKLIHTDGA